MNRENEMIDRVYAAKEDMKKADDLICAYLPFIKSEVSRYLKRSCTEQDDEFSIAMIAFHEAIRGYTKDRGAFLKYAALLIRSRLIDYLRKEARHQGHISIYEEHGEDEIPLHERLADSSDHAEESAMRDATRQEIEELSAIMAGFGVGLTDVAENSPKQERTLEACSRAVRYAAQNPELLQELLETKKLPMSRLVSGAGVERKTLERHRKYVLAMLLIQTNGYEIIRGHLKHVLRVKGGPQV
ncbi:MAG: sigma-70 family RNA polymerase sigma factor [Lachnospiraceae bacterium]|nr:sigma-70 family RNA polymerase sigma factor [Lachnospiraceae bacterium]